MLSGEYEYAWSVEEVRIRAGALDPKFCLRDAISALREKTPAGPGSFISVI
jgi:hypothetical protein